MEGVGLSGAGPAGEPFGGVFRGRRVLVTGHTGFKGSWLVHWLQQLGAEVSGLALPADTTPSHHALLAPGIDEALVDLADARAVAEAVRRLQPEIVFHLAAQALVRRGYAEPEATFATNVQGLIHLLQAVRAAGSVRVVVNATTDKCYDNRETTTPYAEGDALGGRDPYSASKACAEIVSACWRASFLAPAGIRLATARAGNVIGGGDWSADRLLPDLVRAAVAGAPVAIRHPQATRPWQHVLEPLAGYLRLAQRLWLGDAACETAFNFGPAAEGHLPVQAVVQAVAERWPGLRVQGGEPGPHEAGLLHLDATRARQQLGWRPVWSAPRSIDRTVAWYRAWHDGRPLATGADLAQYLADARLAGLAWTQ